MHKSYVTIKQVDLKNNCPECYSNSGLQLTFKQEFLETTLHKTLTQKISHSLYCNTCETQIFPVQWTDDIERVYDYQLKAFTPKKNYLKLKPLALILILVSIVLIAALVTFLISSYR